MTPRLTLHVIFRSLNHPAEELVDLLLAIAEVAALDVVVCLLAPATSGCVQL